MKESRNKPVDAHALFPELLRNYNVNTEISACFVPPPPPPDMSGLSTETLIKKEVVADMPGALVLLGDNSTANDTYETIRGLGYRIETAVNLAETFEKLRTKNFALVLLDLNFEGKKLAESRIHSYINTLPLPQRRTFFYVLVGHSFKTLYDLEALSQSANLTINEDDMRYLRPILRKSFTDHEALYGTFMEILATTELH